MSEGGGGKSLPRVGAFCWLLQLRLRFGRRHSMGVDRTKKECKE
jgi:hypothetical protein